MFKKLKYYHNSNGDIMFIVIWRTIFFYFFITLCYRVMGKREVGQLGIVDLIVSILIAEIVAISIEKTDESMLLAILPIGVLVLLEIILGYISLKSRTFNKIFGGKMTMIISEGKILYKNMVSQRYTIDDLLLELRKKSISSIDEVEYAFLETNGTLSIFPYKPLGIKNVCPLPIIVEGKVQKQNLSYLGKSEEWVLNVIAKNNLNLDDIFYAIIKKTHIYIIRKELS